MQQEIATCESGQEDGDFDGAGTVCDCNDDDSTIYPGAAETNDGIDNNCPGDAGYGLVDETWGNSGFYNPDDANEYSWPAQPGAVRYQVARAAAADFSVACTVFSDITATFLIDPAEPPAAGLFFYLNRATDPNVGSWGQDSMETERTVPCN